MNKLPVTTRAAAALLGIAAILSAVIASCMPVSGLFGLGLKTVDAPTEAESLGSYRIADSVQISPYAVMVHEGAAYYTRFEGTDSTYRLYSVSLEEGSSPVEINATNEHDVRSLIAIPAGLSASGDLEIHGFYEEGLGQVNVVKFSGAAANAEPLPADTIAAIGVYYSSATAGDDGIYFFNDLDDMSLVKADSDYNLLWTVSLKPEDSTLGMQIRSVASTPGGDLIVSVKCDANYIYQGEDDYRGGGVFILDPSDGSIISSRFGAFTFSDPSCIAYGPDETLYVNNASRKMVQAYDADYSSPFYATDESWLGGNPDNVEAAGNIMVVGICPGDETLLVAGIDYFGMVSGLTVFSFSIP